LRDFLPTGRRCCRSASCLLGKEILTPCLSSILAYIIAFFGEKINWQSDGFFTITPLSKMCNFHSFDYDWLRMIITWSWMIMNDREWSWMIVLFLRILPSGGPSRSPFCEKYLNLWPVYGKIYIESLWKKLFFTKNPGKIRKIIFFLFTKLTIIHICSYFINSLFKK
jgi:hypothetical protein